MASKLKDEVKEAIMNNPTLFGLVANSLKIRPISLPQMFKRDSTRLIEFDVLNTVSTYLQKEPSELLVEC